MYFRIPMAYKTDDSLLCGLRSRDPKILRTLYREFFPVAKSIVERNSGSHQDAEDVFQDSIVVLYQRAMQIQGEFKCSLRTFFYAVCKNIWNQRLDRKWRMIYNDDMVSEPAEEYEQDFYHVNEQRLEKLRLFHQHFSQLPCDCQNILQLFMGGIPLRDIAWLTGINSERYVKTRKYLCKNMLQKRIMEDPMYERILQED